MSCHVVPPPSRKSPPPFAVSPQLVSLRPPSPGVWDWERVSRTVPKWTREKQVREFLRLSGTEEMTTID